MVWSIVHSRTGTNLRWVRHFSGWQSSSGLLGELTGNWTNLQQWWKRKDRFSQRCSIARLIPALVWLSAGIPVRAAMTSTGETVLPLLQDAGIKLALGVILWLAIDSAQQNRTNQKYRLSSPSNSSGDFLGDVVRLAKRTATRRAIRRRFPLSRVVLTILAVTASLSVWTKTADNAFAPPIIALWIASGLLWAWVFSPVGWNVFRLGS